MSCANLLNRLARVKETGPGRWVACCPAHEDRSPSLSIRELGDGLVLLHDFGGCGTDDVLAAVGLTMSDLFPERLPGTGPARSYFPSCLRIPAHDLIEVLSEQTSLVALLAADMLENKTISAADWQLLSTAARRIGRIRDQMHGV